MPQIQDIMTRNPVTCYESDIVFKAVEIMKRQNVGVVPIVDQSQVCKGIITDRDIVLDVIYNQKDPKTTLLRDIMTQIWCLVPQMRSWIPSYNSCKADR